MYQDESTWKPLFWKIYHEVFPKQSEIITLGTAENGRK